MNNKCETYDIIISLVKSLKNKTEDGKYEHFIKEEYEGKPLILWGTAYLLNQFLRQLEIPKSRRLVSKKADALWKSLVGDEDINDYYYQDKVTVKHDGKVKKYSGASKTPYFDGEIKTGSSFTFKDVFHEEHIVPIAVIINDLEELEKANKLDYKHVDEVLKKIYICRMLKEEDRKIKERYKRANNKDDVVRDVYNQYEIYLVEKQRLI